MMTSWQLYILALETVLNELDTLDYIANLNIAKCYKFSSSSSVWSSASSTLDLYFVIESLSNYFY